MGANDRLNAMCRPVSDFWVRKWRFSRRQRTKPLCLQGHAVSIGQIDLTPCFEDVALLLVPSIFLILLAMVQFFVESRPDAIIHVRRTKLHVLRTVPYKTETNTALVQKNPVNKERSNYYRRG